jgi:hypothetical protein
MWLSASWGPAGSADLESVPTWQRELIFVTLLLIGVAV